MIFDLTIIGFGVIGVETLDGIKKILLKQVILIVLMDLLKMK